MTGKISRCCAGRGGLVMAVLVLSGCATQQYQPAPLEPRATVGAFEARRLDDPAVAEFARAVKPDAATWPPTSWSADDLFTAALYHDDRFAEARAEWRAASGEVTTASRRPPLALTLTSEYDSDPDEEGATPWTLGGLLDWVWPGPDKRAARIDVAKARADARRWALGEAAWTARERVHRQFLALHDRRRRVQLARQEREIAAEAAELLEQRRALGEAGGVEASTMRLRLQRSRLDLSAARRNVATARAALAAAVGVPSTALQTGAEQLASPHGPLPDLDASRVRETALQARYDVRRLLAEYAVAEAELRAAVAAQYPDITLSPGLIFDQGDRVWVLDASWLLKLPSHQDGPIAAARAQRDAAAARFRALQARVIGDLEQALADYRGRVRMLATAEDVLAAQRDYEAGIRERFEAGYVDRLVLLTARIETLAARRARQDARSAARRSLAALETAAQSTLAPGDDADELIARFVRGAETASRSRHEDNP